MAYLRLFLLVEGDDDERFFDAVLAPCLRQHYDHVQIWKYSQKKRKQVSRLLKSIEDMAAHYIFVADFDGAPCVTARKQALITEHKRIERDRIAVVIREIESWYYGGIDHTQARRLGVKHLDSTDELTKGQFDDLIPGRFESRIDFLSELLKVFSPEEAKRKNRSFRFFASKFAFFL